MMNLLLLAAAALSAGQGLPDWMAGCWVSESAGEWTEECWTPARGGIMLGTNRGGETAKPDAVANWEMMQIGPVDSGEGNIAFRASLRGSAWTPFARTASDGRSVTFENAGHDYPQRIRYWREGEALRAEISRRDGSEPVQWTFRKSER